jgi:hypothetical protein
MSNPTARIKAREPYSPYALRVVQTSQGVFWDVEDTTTGSRRFIISVKPKSARKLAQWILDNVKEE